ncbi:hypothetical protein PARMER_02546 [Parabacteroides merdae ATCC 43184]|nr:hypothetical protein PARMER_02546 [Parabacteroides merdae ATCC 43184]
MVRNKCIVYEEVAAGIGTFDGRISSYKLSAWWRTIVCHQADNLCNIEKKPIYKGDFTYLCSGRR